MTILAGVSKIVIRGTLPQGEQFNTGLWTAGNMPTSAAQANTFAATIASLVSTHIVPTWQPFLSTLAAFTDVKTYHYPNGGPSAGFLGTATIAGGAGTSATAYLPLQLAWVATLRTGFPGRRFRGRMYMPITNHALTNWQFTQADVDSLTTAVRNFINGINTNGTVGLSSIVSQVGTGATASITRVDGDSRLDVQRRRANRETVLFSKQVVV